MKDVSRVTVPLPARVRGGAILVCQLRKELRFIFR